MSRAFANAVVAGFEHEICTDATNMSRTSPPSSFRQKPEPILLLLLFSLLV